MLVTVKIEEILDGIRRAANILPAKAGSSYLRALWLEAKDGYLTFMSTDTALEFTGKYPATVTEDGLVGVNGRQFVDLMNRMKSGEVTLKLDEQEGALSIEKGKKSKYSLPVSDTNWFQKLEEFPTENVVQWSGDCFREAVVKTLFCVDDNETSDALACLFIGKKEEKDTVSVDIAGLNGHQFAVVNEKNDTLAEIIPEGDILIQKRHVNELLRWLPDGDIELSFTAKRVFIRIGDPDDPKKPKECVSLPRSAFKYPDYSVFLARLETSEASVLTIRRQELKDALERLSVFTTENNRFAMFNFSDTELALSVVGQEVGKGVETIEINYKPGIKSIGFPVKDFIGILEKFISEEITLRMTPNDGPCGITGKDDPDYGVLIMPMKTIQDDYYSDDSDEEESGDGDDSEEEGGEE